MRLLSFNVNGIRAISKKGFSAFLKHDQPDILCLQEIKISDAARAQTEFDFADYQEFWHPAQRPGYSGTAILVKQGIQAKDLPHLAWDTEGRVQVLDVGKYFVANIYFPNANHELTRLGFKIEFNGQVLKYLKKLETKKPLVVCGDFNVAHQEIDLARPKDNVGNPGFTTEERAWMTQFLKNGFKDTFRELYPKKVQYSWWSYRSGARARNIGWRIDYFCVSQRLLAKINKAFILDKVMGSDHAPVGIEIKD